MNRDVLLLQRSTDAAATQDLLEGLAREAHSLRGAAHAAGVEHIEALAGRLEDVFERLRKREMNPDAALCDVVGRVVDGARALAREATAGVPSAVDPIAIAALLDDAAGPVIQTPPRRPAQPTAQPAAVAARETPRAAGDTTRAARSKLEALVAAVNELAAANAAAEQRLTELRDLAGELHDLLLVSPVTAAGQVDIAPAPGPTSPVLLLVENSRTARTVQKHLLERAGYEVRTAEDGIEAWKMLQGSNVSVVISDALMPRMDGFELTQQIRGHPRLSSLPVILITATDSPERRRRSTQVGADAYIIKGSAEHHDLASAIERLTRER